MQRATKRVRKILVCMVVVVLAAACPYYYKTPAPQHFMNVDSTPFDSVVAYAHSLGFDTMRYTADVRRVKFDTLGRSTVDPLGEVARIEPESGAWNVTVNELARGRIIARIRTDSAHSANGYGPWWTWWWVDKHGAPGDTSWRSVMISEGLKALKPGGLVFTDHSPYQWRQSIARWGSQWSTCSASACCVKE